MRRRPAQSPSAMSARLCALIVWKALSQFRETYPELKNERLYQTSNGRWRLDDMVADLEIYRSRNSDGPEAVTAAPGRASGSEAPSGPEAATAARAQHEAASEVQTLQQTRRRA
eukprot:3500651-Amphidinium_carterae.1